MKWMLTLTRVWIWIRKYLVTLSLIVVFVGAMLEVYIFGVGPMPQQPPDGYTVERSRAALQWSRGTHEGDLTLQVSIDDPDFNELIVDKKVTGKTYSVKDLKRGKTYYWRIVGDGVESPTAKFKASAYAIDL